MHCAPVGQKQGAWQLFLKRELPLVQEWGRRHDLEIVWKMTGSGRAKSTKKFHSEWVLTVQEAIQAMETVLVQWCEKQLPPLQPQVHETAVVPLHHFWTLAQLPCMSLVQPG